MTQALISVVLPVRNGANYLAQALDSILGQTYPDFVLHVSDNASDDDTPLILAEYASRDSRVRVSRSAELIAQPDNVNRAMRLSDSVWVKPFCHDDIMEPDCLERLVAAIRAVEGRGVDLIGNGERHLVGDRYLTPGNGDRGLSILDGRDTIARKLWDLARAVPFPALTTATVRRDAFEAWGGFNHRYIHFDTFLWLEMLTGCNYAVLDAPLTRNRIHSGQVAVQTRKSLRELADFRAFLPYFVKRYGKQLGIGWKARLRLRLMPAAFGARAVAGYLAGGRLRQAAATAWRIPLVYWPVMPLLLIRATLQERARLARLSPHVPRELLILG